MALEGLDPEVVTQLANQLKTQSQAIGGVIAHVDGIVSHIEGAWQGHTASEFAGWWRQQHRPGLVGAQTAVDGLHQSALNNVAQQEAASGNLYGAAVAGVIVLLGTVVQPPIVEPAPVKPKPKTWYEPLTWGNGAPKMAPAQSPLYNQAGPDPTDVQQGALGDCYFAATAASLAEEDPQALKNLIHDNGNGTYTVTFYGKNGASMVTVDGKLYVGLGGSPVYGSEGNGTSWFPILEKAYAEWNGSYDHINNGGLPSDAMFALTGHTASTALLGSSSINSTSDCWNQIRHSIDGHQLMVAGTSKVSHSSVVVGDHAYTVMDYQTHVDGSQWVEIRNPWGLDPSPDGEKWLPIDTFRAEFHYMQWVG